MEIQGEACWDPSEAGGELGVWRQRRDTPKRRKGDGQGESVARGGGRIEKRTKGRMVQSMV